MLLRPFLTKLEKEGKLVRIKKEVSVKYEISNIMYSLNEKPVIFEHVKGYDFPVLYFQECRFYLFDIHGF